MNYSQTAQKIASQGRYGDTTLVHMTPQEVGGLQALARSNGTSLTINPNTGLPEAFNLRGFLPALAGAGLAMIPGLNMNPLTIGLLTGGLGAAATGDIKKGLMIGLGAAGGAGLAGSAGLTGAAGTGGAAGMGGAAGTGITAAPPPIDAGTAFTAGPGSGGAGFSATKGLAGTSPSGYSLAGSGTSGITPSSTALIPKASPSAMDFLASNKSNISMASAPVISAGLEPPGVKPLEPATYRPYDLTIENVSGQDPYAPGSTREREQLRYAFTPRTPTTDPNQALSFRGSDMSTLFAADGGFMGRGDDDPVEMMSGGLAAFKQGQYLQGGGDGMSDSIPAVIANRQPARLADGEFVVPADVVSGLGNGSSNAGAKQLYGMMDRVRKGRTGKKKQAPEIKPTKYMPA
jgi:hypothetical protein